MIKIVFFGSGPVAAKSLELISGSFDIEAVITKPKPAHHKGDFPVLDVIKKHHYKSILVSNRSELDEAIDKHQFKSKLAVLVDFGIIVSNKVIDKFPLGIINSHFSLLPQWRGADPISFAILSGQKQTGVSLMKLVEKMDEGPLLAYGIYDLPKDITTPLLTEHLINFSAVLLKKEIPKYLESPKSSPQSVTKQKVSYSHKLTKKDGIIDWNKSAVEIEREIRAYLGWPGSKTKLAGKEVAITQASVVDHTGKPGKADVIGKNLIVYCGKDALQIEKLKPAGKPEMTGQAFIAGHKNSL